MKAPCAIALALFLCGNLAADDTAVIESRLDILASSFSKSLGEREFRAALRRAVTSREDGRIYLRDLLDSEIVAGSILARRLAERLGSARDKDFTEMTDPEETIVFRFLADVSDISVSVLPGLNGWNAAAPPLVIYTWEAGRVPETVRTFAVSGAVRTLHQRQLLSHPTVVLEIHDTLNTVKKRIPATLSHDEGEVASGPFNYECTDMESTYSSYPLIVSASIRDAHESFFDGPEGFLYFRDAGSEKTGNLPLSLGGRSGWYTNVWASNFQGPRPVSKILWPTMMQWVQWEWTADDEIEESNRIYPAPYCLQTVDSPAEFATSAYTIDEDDDGGNPDDYVGKVQIEHSYCKSEVFDQGLSSGWSNQHSTPGVDDIASTTYELYCSTNYGCFASTQCPDGSALYCSHSGTCSEESCVAGGTAVACGGILFLCR